MMDHQVQLVILVHKELQVMLEIQVKLDPRDKQEIAELPVSEVQLDLKDQKVLVV